MRAIVVKPGETAYVADIVNSLESLQHIVGGYIEACYPWEDLVAIICNEEGKILQLPLNRQIRDDDGNVTDIIAGTFLIVGLSDDDFTDLSVELVDKYLKLFEKPQYFCLI